MLNYTFKTTKKIYRSFKQDPDCPLVKKAIIPLNRNYIQSAEYANEVIVKFNKNAIRADKKAADTNHWKVKRDNIVAASLTKKPTNGIQEVGVVDENKLLNGEPGKQYVTGTYTKVDADDPSTYDVHPNSKEIVDKHPIIGEIYDKSLANENKKTSKVVNKHTYPEIIQDKQPKQPKQPKHEKTKKIIDKNETNI